MTREPYSTGRFADVDSAQVRDREGLATMVEAMLADLYAHPDEWENANLAAFLEALSASIRDIVGAYENRGVPVPKQPSWAFVAEVLVMATGYE